MWLKHKENLREDILKEALILKGGLQHVQQPMENILHTVDSTVLLYLQDELEHMGTCLENLDQPTLDKCNRVKRIPQVIQDEMFDIRIQKLKGDQKCQSFNAEQQTAFSIITWAVCVDNCDKRIFFLNAPSGCGKTFLIDALLVTVRGMGTTLYYFEGWCTCDAPQES